MGKMTNDDTTGKRISKLLIDLGLQQKQLIERMAGRGEGANRIFVFETKPSMLSKIVNDRGGITPIMMTALAEALGTTVDYIMCAPWAADATRTNDGITYMHQQDAERGAAIIDSISDEALRKKALDSIQRMAEYHAEAAERKSRAERLHAELSRIAANLSERERKAIEAKIGVKLASVP